MKWWRRAYQAIIKRKKNFFSDRKETEFFFIKVFFLFCMQSLISNSATPSLMSTFHRIVRYCHQVCQSCHPIDNTFFLRYLGGLVKKMLAKVSLLYTKKIEKLLLLLSENCILFISNDKNINELELFFILKTTIFFIFFCNNLGEKKALDFF